MVAIAAFGLMSIASCESKETPPPVAGTNCQVTNNATPVTSTIGADGTMYDAKVIFYSADAEISEASLGSLTTSGGMSEIKEAPEGATRARIAFLLMPSTNTDPTNVMQYTVDYFALTADVLTSISITDLTMLTSTKSDMKGTGMTFREALMQF